MSDLRRNRDRETLSRLVSYLYLATEQARARKDRKRAKRLSTALDVIMDLNRELREGGDLRIPTEFSPAADRRTRDDWCST